MSHSFNLDVFCVVVKVAKKMYLTDRDSETLISNMKCFFRTVCINGDNDELTDLTTTAPKDVDAETLGEFTVQFEFI
jgi:hypothetical protein